MMEHVNVYLFWSEICHHGICTIASQTLVATYCVFVSNSIIKLSERISWGKGGTLPLCLNLALIQSFPRCMVR